MQSLNNSKLSTSQHSNCMLLTFVHGRILIDVSFKKENCLYLKVTFREKEANRSPLMPLIYAEKSSYQNQIQTKEHLEYSI